MDKFKSYIRNCSANRRSILFCIAIAVSVALRLWIVHGITILAMPGAACDDQLMKFWAFSIAGGRWLDTLDSFTFIKEPGFSIFLAMCYRFQISYITGVTLVYIGGALVFCFALRHLVKNRLVWYLIYIVVLFNPISYAQMTLQRVYRNGLGLALTLWVFGGILNLYFNVLEERGWKMYFWSVLTSASLGFLWIVKNDTIWLMPFVITILIVSAFLLLIKRRKISSILRGLFLVVPVLGILASTTFVSHMNIRTYGADGIKYYGPALANMTTVVQDKEVANCSMTRATFEKLCDLSPTLNKVRACMLENMDSYDKYDTTPGDGNVEDGWIGWAFLSTVKSCGYYSDIDEANSFYENVYQELEAAYEDGKISRHEKSTTEKYYLDTSAHRKKLLSAVGKIIGYTTSMDEIRSSVHAYEETEIDAVMSFSILTQDEAIYDMGKKDYQLTGWMLYPKYHLKKLKVVVEDEKGNELTKVHFINSPDILTALPEENDAKKCRFNISWAETDSDADQYYVCAYDGKKLISKAEITSQGFVSDQDNWNGSVDNYLRKSDETKKMNKAEHAVGRLNMIKNIYKAVSPIVTVLGLLGYCVFTGTLIVNMKRKVYNDVNAWLVITGISLSLLVLYIGVAVTHLTQCPAINYMYLSSSYALAGFVSVFSIVKCVESILNLKRNKE